MTIDISPEAVDNPCTCHPDDQPPKPCPQKYALTECRIAALSPALAALAMRERAAELCFVPEQAHIAWDMKNGNFPKRSARHEYIAAEIRAIPTTFTDAELLAAAMQLPEVRALVESADNVDDEYCGQVYGPTMHTIEVLRAAIAPFRKVDE